MIVSSDLRKWVVRPTLQKMNLWSESAEQLIMGTAAQESRLGTFLKQIEGPALGIYQIEPTTHQDLWTNYLSYRPEKAALIAGFASRNSGPLTQPDDQELVTNLAYATVIARMIYFRVPEALPDGTDISALALYWKTHYNTNLGKGKISEFEQNFRKYVN